MDEDLDIVYDENATDYDEIDEDEAYEEVLDRLLDNVPDDIDKREGSVIYNALAPAAAEISLLYQELKYVQDESFADTASLDYLIRRAAERGIIYREATKAVVKGQFSPDTIDVIGCRFWLVDTELSYVATKKLDAGIYELECEVSGLDGNVPSGQLILDESNGNDDVETLEISEIIGVVEAAIDDEDVEVFRGRYFDSFEAQRFGGNVADYKTYMVGLTHVGGCKVYPVWNGGGTVKVVFITESFDVPNSDMVSEVQEAIDPTQNQGKGYGIAPIGHVVTIAAATSKAINVQAEISYAPGFSYDTAKDSIEAALDEYFLSLRKEWGNGSSDAGVVVRISQIETRLLNLSEILDIQNTTINESTTNLELEPEEIPVRGDFIGT